MREVYSSLDDAPIPKADGEWIVVEFKEGQFQDYRSKNGKYVPDGLPYRPATMD
jgi:hypothetical protein